MKIRYFVDESTLKKRKLFAKEINTTVEDLLTNSLDKVRAICISGKMKNKSGVLVIPKVNRKRKSEGKSSDVVT